MKKIFSLILMMMFLLSCSNTVDDFEIEMVKVEEVVDGDTIKVSINGKSESIRFIGINTPEVERKDQQGEYYGQEASDFTKSMLEGEMVYLTKDVSDRDKYGRLLRFIWIEKPLDPFDEKEINEKMFNALLLKEGYAHVVKYEPDVTCYDYFFSIQEEAKQSDKGMWNDDSNGVETLSIVVFDKYKELIILENKSDYAIDLEGYKLISVKDADSQFFEFKQVVIDPNEEIILYCGPNSKDYDYDILWSEEYLFSNSKEDPIALLDRDGKVIDRVNK